jgi:hypothetical protein
LIDHPAPETIDRRTPIVPMRVSSINGKPVSDLIAKRHAFQVGQLARAAHAAWAARRSPWALRHEFAPHSATR